MTSCTSYAQPRDKASLLSLLQTTSTPCVLSFWAVSAPCVAHMVRHATVLQISKRLLPGEAQRRVPLTNLPSDSYAAMHQSQRLNDQLLGDHERSLSKALPATPLRPTYSPPSELTFSGHDVSLLFGCGISPSVTTGWHCGYYIES